MKVTRIFAGDDGESHFEDLEYDLHATGSGMLSEVISTTGMILRETPADYNLDFHPAPRRQFIVNLDAAVEIEVGDGSKRVIGPGEIFLAEDTTGHGHISRSVNGKVRHSIFVTLD
jgi:hypothetical protein